MKINKLILVITILSIGATAWFYRYLPDQIPLHFNINGEVNNRGSRNFIWLTSSLPLLLYLLMTVIPKIDPRRDSYEKHMRGYSILAAGITLFLTALNGFTIAWSLGYELKIQTFVLAGLGVLFILIGNNLPNARQNYTFGIRTPWTLADGESWTKTHRAGGYVFVLEGVLFIIGAFLPGAFAFVLMLSTLILSILGLTVYSYLIFAKKRA